MAAYNVISIADINNQVILARHFGLVFDKLLQDVGVDIGGLLSSHGDVSIGRDAV